MENLHLSNKKKKVRCSKNKLIKKKGLTFELHPDFETLLETTVRAPLPLSLIDLTVSVRHTRVHFLVLDGPLEESFAGLAGQQAVVIAGHFVTAHGAGFLDEAFLGVRKLLTPNPGH